MSENPYESPVMAEVVRKPKRSSEKSVGWIAVLVTVVVVCQILLMRVILHHGIGVLF